MGVYLRKRRFDRVAAAEIAWLYSPSPMAGGDGDGWRGAGAAWSVMGTLLSGILAWGGLGYLIDRLVGFHWLFLPIGMVVGVGTAIYLVYLRYGRDDQT
jgi:ATP synthase protein I